MFKFYTHPHLTSPIKGEETFFPRPWWEGLGEGGTDTLFLFMVFNTHHHAFQYLLIKECRRLIRIFLSA